MNRISLHALLAVGMLGLACATTEYAAAADSAWSPDSTGLLTPHETITGSTLADRISEHLHLETRYLALGFGSYRAPALPSLLDTGRTAYTMTSTWSGLASVPALDRWGIYLRVGMMLTESDWQLTDADPLAPILPHGSAIGDDWLWGLGIDYQISPRWSGRLDFQQVPGFSSPGFGGRDAGTDLNLLSIGISYDF